ncbi:MAG TPA: hypothetical protein VGD37_36105 [Kofleriaceae bacterium]
MKRLAVLVFLVGCGGDDASLDDLALGCVQREQPATFATSSDLAPAVRGTLAGWNPDGRWFVTGARFPGISSFHLRRSGAQVIVDRDAAAPGSFDDTEIFTRVEATGAPGKATLTAKRISNLRPDGTARVERATCTDGVCTVCTGKLIRATHNAGEGEGDHITLLGQLADPTWGPGYTFNVRVAGTLAYLIRQDGLHIIETADPAHPVELGRYRRPLLGYSNDVKLIEAGARRFALIADTPVDVVDVTDPRAPALAAQIPEGAHTVFTEARGGTTRAYFGGYDGNCPVYDVTNPAVPAKLGSYAAGAALVHDLSVVDGIAYLNAWDKGFLVVDFTAPATPRLLRSWAPTPIHTSHSNWTTTAGGRHIALHGEEGYAAKLDILDLDTAQPVLSPIASWQTRTWISIHNIMAFGTKAYFTYYQDGVRVLDVADPLHPRQIGYYNTWDPDADYTSSAFFESAVGLDVDQTRKLIFVADSPRGLLILRDDTP